MNRCYLVILVLLATILCPGAKADQPPVEATAAIEVRSATSAVEATTAAEAVTTVIEEPVPIPLAVQEKKDPMVERFGRTWTNRQDSIILGGSQEIPWDRACNDVVTVFGKVGMEGYAKDMVTVFGTARVGKNAIIRGDLVCVFGKVTVEEGADIQGDIVRVFGNVRELKGTETVSLPGLLPEFFFPFGEGMRPTLGMLVLLQIGHLIKTLLLALLVTALASKGILCIRDQMVRNPFVSSCVGLGGIISVFPVCLILIVTCIGLLLVPVVLVVYWVAFLVGMTTVHFWLGHKIRIASRGNTHRPYLDVTIGVLVLFLVGLIPIAGGIINFVLGLAGFGALILTRFGTREGIGLENSHSVPVVK